MQVGIRDEYLKAQRMGLKEKKELEAARLDPNPKALEDVLPEAAHLCAVELPLCEIPADRIVGTYSRGRASAFSASFLPLPDANSEFAAKWMALCDAHLSDTGIRDHIECCEYLGRFYVTEGNKRVSVLKYFGAVRIGAKVKRILPEDTGDPAAAFYPEFLDFYRKTGSYDIIFNKSGEYLRLYSAMGRKADDEWSAEDITRLISAFGRFKEAFGEIGGKERGLAPEEALLLFLKVHPYDELTGMSVPEIKTALTQLWSDVKTSSDPEAIRFNTVPEEEKRGVIQKLINAAPKHLNIAFVCQRNADESPWTKGHIEGTEQLKAALGGAVSVKTYFNADTPEEADRLLDEAAADGAELVFTTTPPLLDATLRAAIRHPKLKYYNCSACQPLSSVKSYYCRTYEGKFITGMIAGALAENDLVGYIGSYPILGVPASINAFALGARMTNPRARVLLEWTCLEVDCIKKLREKGVKVISNRDIPVPDPSYMDQGYYGTFLADEEGGMRPLASPCWMWGRLYENIVRGILSGGAEKKEQAVNYWWGMDSGVIDVAFSPLVPPGVRALAEMTADKLKKGELDVFGQRLYAQDGSLISDGVTPLSSMEILRMDRLSEAVEGHIPEYDELLPIARGLVRELGLHRESIAPEEISPKKGFEID